MARILSPNKQYSGVSAGITFVNGIGNTDCTHLIKWFRNKGYAVEEDEEINTKGLTKKSDRGKGDE